MRKFTSLILVSALVIASGFTGCSVKSSKEVLKVSEGTPWYTCEILELGQEYTDYEFMSGTLRSGIVGHIPEGYVYMVTGACGEDYENLDRVNYVCLYSDSGELISEINVTPYLEEYNCGISSFGESYFIEDDIAKLTLNNYSDDGAFVCDIDFENNVLGEPHTNPTVEGWNWSSHPYSVTCGEYKLYVSIDFARNALILLTVDSDGNSLLYNVTENYPTSSPTNVYYPLVISDTEVLLLANDGTQLAYIFDVVSQTFREAGSEFDWLVDELTGTVDWKWDSDGTFYLSDGVTIRVPNYEECAMETLVEMENIDINRNWIRQSIILELSNEKITFADLFDSSNTTVHSVYKATLADVNPNVGKTIVTTDGTNDIVYEAAYRFNRTDDEYFVRIVPYEYNYYNIGLDNPDEYDALLRNSRQDAGDQLMVDLIAGDCPDVVFYASDFAQLNNGNCMMDLSSFYDESNLDEIIYGNLVDAAKIGDGLYAIPLQFELMGIGVSRFRLDGFEGGMTFDEFLEFIDRYTNGKNPVAMNQLDFIKIMVANNYDLLLDDNGRINFDCDAFREIAEFANDYVNNGRDYYSDISTTVSASSWFTLFDQQNVAFRYADFIGFPSCDGRGPMMVPRLSASITSGTAVPEGAWRFICMLLDTEVQTYVTSAYGLNASHSVGYSTGGIASPVNRVALQNILQSYVDSYTAFITEQYEMSGGFSNYQPGTLENIEHFAEIVETVDHSYISDSNIEVIIYEEMQAYLVGDKTLDEVIEIMNNRAQIVLDEREG